MDETPQSQQQLLQVERHWKDVLDAMFAFVALMEPDGTITWMNKAAQAVAGPVDAIGTNFTELHSFGHSPRLREQLAESVRRAAAGELVKGELENRPAEDAPMGVSFAIAPRLDANGQVVELIASGVDISERQTAERALQASEARYRKLLELNPEAIVVNQDMKFTYVNRAAVKLFGASSAGQLIGQSPLDFRPPESREALRRAIASMLETGEALPLTEEKVMALDGTLIDVEVAAAPIAGTEHDSPAVLAVFRDISRRLQAQAESERLREQLERSQRMESLGRLAGGIAHDFNNLLAVIVNYASLAVLGTKPGDQLRADMEEIQRAARKAADLTRQLVIFGKQELVELKLLNVNSILCDLRELLGRTIGENIELRFHLTDSLWQVKMDPTHVEQVILNLVVNGRDAMRQGGRLVLETCNVQVDEHSALTVADARTGDFVRLTVADTGSGMTDEVKNRLFDPFFTTKAPGEGTGLGLATVHSIVTRAGGHVNVYSELGRGSVFRVYLPAAEDSPEGQTEPGVDTSVPAPGRGEAILLVEDEEAVRNGTSRLLEQHGYRVTSVGLPSEALSLADDGQAIDLLLTDVVMPQMSGLELAEKLTGERAGTKVLFMSGYPRDIVEGQGTLPPGAVLVQKPCSTTELLRQVRRVIDAGP